MSAFFKSKFAAILGAFICIVSCLSIGLAYTQDEKLTQLTDFRNSFYIAGLLTSSGRLEDVYPTDKDQFYDTTIFNKFAHQQLNQLDSRLTANFLYPPQAAEFFALFAHLPAKLAMLLFCTLSVFSLALSAFLFSRTVIGEVDWRILFLLSYLSLPVANLIFFGQVGIVFSLLPLSLGYYLLNIRHPFAAGMAFAISAVKPQIFEPMLFVVVASALNAFLFPNPDNQAKKLRRRECVLLSTGMLAGLILFQLAPLCLSGSTVMHGWLNGIRIASHTLSAIGQGWAPHLMLSLAGTMMVLSPSSVAPIVDEVAPIVSFMFCIAAVVFLCIAERRASIATAQGRNILILIAFAFLPLFSPYIRLYDYAVYLLPAWIAVFGLFENATLKKALARRLIWGLITVNSYLISFFVLSAQNAKWLLPLVLAVLLWSAFGMVRDVQADLPKPAEPTA